MIHALHIKDANDVGSDDYWRLALAVAIMSYTLGPFHTHAGFVLV